MDFELNTDQQAVLDAVGRLLTQHGGPARAIQLNRANEYDHALHTALADAGFANIARDLASDDRPATLEAALVIEAIARAGGVIAAGAQLLVAPLLLAEPLDGPVALCTEEELARATPIRFAAHARDLLVLAGDDVRHLRLAERDAAPVRTSFGYPMGRVAKPAALREVQRVPDAGPALTRWWRLSLAVEAVGTMDAALTHTVDYLKQRRQFGRAIGSFQAVQHRLAHCAIQVEASRWLAREAAWHGASSGATAEAAAAAAAFALQAADLVFTETHQLSGAIGFTCEFDLHVWSMRLLALRQELAGVGGARRALVAARWGGGA